MAKPSTALTPRRSAKPPALVATSLDDLEQAIGGREALVAALMHAPKSAGIDYLLGLIGTPPLVGLPPMGVLNGRHPTASLATLCAQGGITPGELMAAYRSGVLAKAQTLALHQVGQQLAAVTEDTMRRALPQTGQCDACDGTGTVVPEPSKKNPNPHPEPCRACKGTGTRTVQGDLEHKKLALDMGKMLPKSGGVNIAVNQQQNTFVGGAAGGALERMQAATDAILYGAGDPAPEGIIDLEPVEGTEADPPTDAAVLEGDWREDQQA